MITIYKVECSFLFCTLIRIAYSTGDYFRFASLHEMHSLSIVPNVFSGTEIWHRLIWCKSILGSTDVVRLVHLKVQSSPVPKMRTFF